MNKRTLLLIGCLVFALTFRQVEIHSSGKPPIRSESTPAIPSPTKPVSLALPLASRVAFPISLKKYEGFSHKALPTREEQEKIHQLLAEPSLIKESQKTLLGATEYSFSSKGQKRRMESVDFLYDALRWKENPNGDLAVRAVLAVLDRDLGALRVPRDLKRSFAGDQIELYQILLRTRRDLARKVFYKYQNHPQEALIAYAIEVDAAQLEGDSK